MGNDAAADAYDLTQRVLEDAGFDADGISNHARGATARAQHNLTYWRGGDYVGVGPGAHGRLTLGGRRHAMVAPRAIADYIAGAGPQSAPMTANDVASERLLMGLRTDEGVAWSDLAPLAIPEARIAALEGYLVLTEGRLMATRRGRPVLDHLIGELAARGVCV